MRPASAKLLLVDLPLRSLNPTFKSLKWLCFKLKDLFYCICTLTFDKLDAAASSQKEIKS